MRWFRKRTSGAADDTELTPDTPDTAAVSEALTPEKDHEAPAAAAATADTQSAEPAQPSRNEDQKRSNPLKRDLEVALADKERGVVMKLYVDNFKQLNDVFGHDYCEVLLSQILSFLSRKTQTFVYRYIGVEFIMILKGRTQGQANALAAELISRFDQVWSIDSTDCLCSVQIGLCSYHNQDFTVDGLLKCLDISISHATEMGANQFVMFDSKLQKKYLRKKAIALRLQSAIENNLIEVRYRPTYHMETERFTRADFYMRIFIEGIGMVGAADFLPVAEDSGQVRAVEYFALDQVGACIADLIAAGKQFDSISIPISPILLLQRDFLDKIREILDTYRIPRGKLAIEIDESAITTASLTLNDVLTELSSLGIELILNDFGSGCASIVSILQLPINTLKLERMFVWQLETNSRSAYIINGLIQLARRLKLHIIAEGVETVRQLATLESFYCEYEQGFYYAPTVEKEVLVDLMGTSLRESRQLLSHEKQKMKGLKKP